VAKYVVHPTRKNIWVPKRLHAKVARAWAQYDGPLSIGDFMAEIVEKTIDKHLAKLKRAAVRASAHKAAK